MKRTILATLVVFCCFSLASAQAPKVELSEPFEEPTEGWRKVLQLKNGTTFFFNYIKKGIDVAVYDKSRKKIAQKNITSELWNPRAIRETKIAGLYEIGGKPVIFMQQVLDRTPQLFRITFNPATGAVDEEKMVSSLDRYKAGSGFAMVWGNVDPAEFHIEKDPASDNYAIINFNSFTHESGERIEAMHFGIDDNGKHKLVNKAFYDAQGFKYLRFIGMTVDNDKLILCTYGYNTENSGGKDSRVIISRLRKSEKEFSHRKLEFTDDFKDTRALMQYNPGSGLIQLLTLTHTKSKNNMFTGKRTNSYVVLISYIDPEHLTITDVKPLAGEKVESYIQSHMDSDKPYGGMPQQMYINNDNTTTILQEEIFKLMQTSYGRTVTVKTELGKIGISELDTKGNELNGYAINKAQSALGDVSGFYTSDRDKGVWNYQQPVGLQGINTPFYSFDYVNTPKNKYLIFNDFPENFSREEKKRRKTVDNVTSTSTVCYKLNNGQLNKYFLYGAPKDDDEGRFTCIEASHYLKEGNTYATLIVDKRGRKKQAHIAWVRFD